MPIDEGRPELTRTTKSLRLLAHADGCPLPYKLDCSELSLQRETVLMGAGAVVGGLVGLGLVLAGLVTGRTRRARERGWLEAPGEIVSLVPGDINAGMYHPVAQYVRAEGSTEQVRDSPATQPPRFRVGDRVLVRYDPADPRLASIGGGGASILPGVLLGIGVLVLVTALAVGASAVALG